VNQVEDLLAKKVDAIILSPMDGKAVVLVLKKAQADKIPVIVADSSVEKGNEGVYICYVGTDNFNAGKAAGSAW
jgi:ribose transport system substrate-binding protein